MTKRLIFVYNANAGLLAGVMDSVHKTLSPDTYECDLCALTHGILTMRPEWREYLKTLPVEAEFFHRPDFRQAFPEQADTPLPLVAVVEGGTFSMLLDADALGEVNNVEQLIAALQAKLN